jgi:hypothetical protein
MNKIYQVILTSPAIPINAMQKVITISSPDKGAAMSAVISDLEKNKITNYGINMVGEFEAEAFAKSLSLTLNEQAPAEITPTVAPIEYKVVEKVEEKSDLTKEQKFDSWAAMLRKNGYSVKKSRTILE